MEFERYTFFQEIKLYVLFSQFYSYLVSSKPISRGGRRSII